MTDTTIITHCARCKRHSEHLLCDVCVQKGQASLTSLLTFTRMIDATPKQGARNAGKSSERTLGVSVDGLDVVAGLVTVPLLESWEKWIRSEFNLTPYGVATASEDKRTSVLERRVAFLSAWLHALVDWEPVTEMLSELRAEAARLSRLAGEAESPGWRVECPADVSSDGVQATCSNRLRVTSIALSDDAEITCRVCGSRWTARRLVTVSAAAADVDVWVSADVLADWFQITPRTLRRWASKGVIERRGGYYSERSVRAAIASQCV